MTTPVFTYNNTTLSSVGVGANIVKVIGIILGINGPVGSSKYSRVPFVASRKCFIEPYVKCKSLLFHHPD